MDVTANALNLPLGIHSRFLTLSSGHPAVPPLSIPVTLQIVAAGDADGDSLPDWWETRHGWAPGDGNPVHGQAGDHDGDGTSNFLEFLLDLNPALADRGGLPACSTAVNPSDGLTYLTFTYRRRVGLAGASYVVQVTDSLGSWTSGPAETEELSATQNAGGESETVLVRVKPALTAPGNNRKFVRVSIAIP
jgi:hypothetical protein